jgi:hypothetical protein
MALYFHASKYPHPNLLPEGEGTIAHFSLSLWERVGVRVLPFQKSKIRTTGSRI